MPMFYTDAYPSCQEGAVEKTSKFIRQYKPYISDISTITDKKIKMVQKNRRSRKK